jgi:hypothetical protein
MDGAEVAVNCLAPRGRAPPAGVWTVSWRTGIAGYRRMAEVMEELDAARNELLDEDDKLVGRVKDKEEVKKRLRHKLLQRNAWRLIPFFKLFMSSPKDELHQ